MTGTDVTIHGGDKIESQRQKDSSNRNVKIPMSNEIPNLNDKTIHSFSFELLILSLDIRLEFEL